MDFQVARLHLLGLLPSLRGTRGGGWSELNGLSSCAIALARSTPSLAWNTRGRVGVGATRESQCSLLAGVD